MTLDNTTVDPAEVRLDKFAEDMLSFRANDFGYPMNHKSRLIGFYRRLADLQNLDLSLIPSNVHGR